MIPIDILVPLENDLFLDVHPLHETPQFFASSDPHRRQLRVAHEADLLQTWMVARQSPRSIQSERLSAALLIGAKGIVPSPTNSYICTCVQEKHPHHHNLVTPDIGREKGGRQNARRHGCTTGKFLFSSRRAMYIGVMLLQRSFPSSPLSPSIRN